MRGARQHNLQGLDLDLPLGQWIAISGVSGSGKSSLALDTLYAEGQRRYVESFSPYARQFLERLDRPRVDRVEGIPPAIAIEQQNPMRTSRSTVATATELADFLKLLFARTAELRCPGCGRDVTRDTPESTLDDLSRRLPEGERLAITFPYAIAPRPPAPGAGETEEQEEDEEGLQRRGRRGRGGRRRAGRGAVRRRRPASGRGMTSEPAASPAEAAAQAVRRLAAIGFHRAWIPAGATDLTSMAPPLPDPIPVLADRVRLEPRRRGRILEALGQAFAFGHGRVEVHAAGAAFRYSAPLHCPDCDRAFPDPDPNLFSFNSPAGACPRCKGFGRVIEIDPDLVVPNPSLALEDGAIKPWAGSYTKERRALLRFAREGGIPTDVPWRDLDEDDRQAIWEGTESFPGVRGFFRWLERKTYKMHIRILLSRYRAYVPCPRCGGGRLNEVGLAWRWRGRNLASILAMSIGEACAFFEEGGNGSAGERAAGEGGGAVGSHAAAPGGGERPADDPASAVLLREIRSRLRMLRDVGLSYMTLDRPSRTLSGGEAQRVALTRALGSSLVNVLYVLDEPSVGLHPRDTDRLIRTLRGIRDMGNTVVIVEHDPDLLRGADRLVDLGPGSGEHGGRLLYEGPPGEAGEEPRSITGAFLSGARCLPRPERRRPTDPSRAVRILGASEHNLKSIDVKIPLGTLTCISGVSGSGKSTLVEEVMHRALLRAIGRGAPRPGAHRGVEGAEHLSDVVLVDQSPAGRTSRATAATYLGVWSALRNLLATTPEARRAGLRPASFSFNVRGGRCETCQGQGFETIEMQFLSDLRVTCPACQGRRFRDEVLDARWNGRNAVEILELTASEAIAFFEEVEPARRALEPLCMVGLEYLRLGQPLGTLSGGEAQRLKLAARIGAARAGEEGGVLFLLDEPTVGLHLADVAKLLNGFEALLNAGHTLVVVEHHTGVLAAADWIVDLGPEAGEAGGRIVCEGPPEAVAACAASHTGRALRGVLAGEESRSARRRGS